jgi:hypothetical protein
MFAWPLNYALGIPICFSFLFILMYVQAALESSPGCLAMFCYSGHGASNGQHHFMLASDCPCSPDMDIDGICIEKTVVMHMQLNASTCIVVMDACRNAGPVHKGAAGAMGAYIAADPWLMAAHSTPHSSLGSLPALLAGLTTKDAGQRAAGNGNNGARRTQLLLCWACSPLSTAADGNVYSPYTGMLLKVRVASLSYSSNHAAHDDSLVENPHT